MDYTPESFAKAVTELLSLPAIERAAMGARGAAWVRDHRYYQMIASGLAKTYAKLLNREPPGTAALNSAEAE